MEGRDVGVITEVRRWLRGYTYQRAEELLHAARNRFNGREHAELPTPMALPLQLKHGELMADVVVAVSKGRSASAAALTRPLLETPSPEVGRPARAPGDRGMT
jgi:hypothetical protein